MTAQTNNQTKTKSNKVIKQTIKSSTKAQKKVVIKNTSKKTNTITAKSKNKVRKIKLTNAVLITGASSGIGLAFAHLYGKKILNNAASSNSNTPKHLILVARRTKLLQNIKADILKNNADASKAKKFATSITLISADLSKPQAAEKLFKKVNEAKLHVNTLVNNAGFGDAKLFVESDIKKNEEMIALNVTALSQIMQIFLPGMQTNKYGRIINVASIAGFMPGPLMATYFATKAYVLSLSIAVRQEMLGSGVHISALCPGPVATGFSNVAHVRFDTPAIAVTSPTQVAMAAIQSVEKNKTHVVPGFINKIIAALPRILSKKSVTASTEKNMQKSRYIKDR